MWNKDINSPCPLCLYGNAEIEFQLTSIRLARHLSANHPCDSQHSRS